jgi:hypothetical protein
MCKEKEKCKNENCKCPKEKETFLKTKVSDIEVNNIETIKPKNHGKETFGI